MSWQPWSPPPLEEEMRSVCFRLFVVFQDPAEFMYIVLSGSVKVYMTASDFNAAEAQVVDVTAMRQQLFAVQDLLNTVKEAL